MGDLVTSAGIQAGAQLGSGIANLALVGSQQHYQRKMMRYQRDIQKELMAEQNAYNLAMMDKEYNQNVALWNMNNEYNDPAAQRARLEAAGYNPYAMLGQGGSIGVSSSPAASAKGEPVGLSSVGVPNSPDMDMSFLGKATDTYFNSLMQSELLKEQAAKAEMAQQQIPYYRQYQLAELQELYARTRKQYQDAANGSVEEDIAGVRLDLLKGTMQALLEEPYLQNDQIRAMNRVNNAQAELIDQEIITEQLKQDLERQNIRIAQRTVDKIGAEIAVYRQQVSLIAAQTDLTRQQKENLIKEYETEFWKGLREKNWYKRESSTNDLYIRQLDSSIDVQLRNIEMEELNSSSERTWRAVSSIGGAIQAVGIGYGAATRLGGAASVGRKAYVSPSTSYQSGTRVPYYE